MKNQRSKVSYLNVIKNVNDMYTFQLVYNLICVFPYTISHLSVSDRIRASVIKLKAVVISYN